MVVDIVPSVEVVRMVNSGTEACLSALRVMRAYTGREKASCLCDSTLISPGPCTRYS